MKKAIAVIVILAIGYGVYSYSNVDSHQTVHAAHWGYAEGNGPAHWAEMNADYHTCKAGQSQSPIDISEAADAELSAIEFNYQPSKIKLLNNGHTIQQNYDAGSYITVNGKRYDLLQFHFHAPSEHTFNGQPRAMVAHLVHKADDGSLAVIGVTFNTADDNAVVAALWSHMPMHAGDKAADDATINAADLLPASHSYYSYSGSLTTPPCSEGVNWMVMKDAVNASEAQVNKFYGVFSKSVRPTQPLHGREVQVGG
jgi:carbonic anhydrase